MVLFPAALALEAVGARNPQLLSTFCGLTLSEIRQSFSSAPPRPRMNGPGPASSKVQVEVCAHPKAKGKEREDLQFSFLLLNRTLFIPLSYLSEA